MKRVGLLVVLLAAAGVTSLMADHKGWGRYGSYQDGPYVGGYGLGQGLPPGLARRSGNLPPGLQRYLGRTGHLPPGLEKKLGRYYGSYYNPGVFIDRDRDGFDDRFEQRLSDRRRRGCR